MVYSLFLLIIGFVCLVKGADFFVSGSSAIARYFKIPSFIIGLTIVAFGTSLPEAAVSITAAMREANGIAVGNVLGSNIFNLLMVLGISAIIKSCPVSKAGLKFEYPLSIVAAAMIIVLSAGTGSGTLILSRADGIIILAVFVIFLIVTVRSVISSKNKSNNEISDIKNEEDISLLKGFIYSIIGIAGIIIGGDVVVDSATVIAQSFGIDETLIGLTIVAMGTSLPELVTSIVAALKGETDIAIGNVIGSNIFNILFVLGVSVIINPIEVSLFSIYDAAILVIISLIVLIPMVKNKALTRSWGFIMVLMYAAYLYYIITRSM
ncbi:MAG: calcium/sodium antiporter [Anaerovoracaceae bacterium]